MQFSVLAICNSEAFGLSQNTVEKISLMSSLVLTENPISPVVSVHISQLLLQPSF